MSKPSGCSDDGGSLSLENQLTHGSSQPHQQPQLSVPKKKRNLPGTPDTDPDAEVVALSPGTLMATNRFVCEICNKGFQRDQNLQLHRRGHNLPWKLKQRTSGSDTRRRRVYVCPETSCVHHNPARALGDLTGIKKHFSRKHGEKNWKCEKCSKKYAVHSDLKAHLKTCGSKEYKCDCGTVFSRRDSFITHRAYCDALTEESNKLAGRGATMAASPPITLPHHDLMPIPPKPFNLSAGSMFSSSISNDHHFPSSSSAALMSATALLQKAAQMGAAVSSPIIQQKNGFVTTMAPSSFGGMLPTTCLQKCPQENIGGGVDMEMIDDILMLNGMFDKSIGEGARKTMTLDLLGAEGGKGRKFQAEESVGFGGVMENVGYFCHQGAMGKQGHM
ncbi:protein indeterminate-domain 7-like isoform X1 [Cucurbita moschata]|uniref:Protein indeterminate-domain 7-like isoform X1 n=1 Tax=Cucurbita moschata TaxID=3662 RepID=A0A6J1EIJ6_CUCMO|nr:protein indeterminate-domain 7-like isoform X1 [Cucurbita moschata]